MTDSSSQHNIAARYHEIDGIVWMKRNNHLPFTNNKHRQVNYGPFPTSVKFKMELDKGVPTRKDIGTNDKSADGEDSEQSSYEENYSDQDITLNDEDVWDDSLLIKMYEASQMQINDELTKRFTSKTCDSSNEEPNYSASVTNTGNIAGNITTTSSKIQKLKHIFNSKKVTPKATFDSKPVLSKLMNWKEGDYCQLTYLEDNVDYEAKIISINPSEQTCLVRYIGYENEEVRSLNDLKSSEGEKVRTLQIEMSIQDGYGKATADAVLEEPTIHLQATQPELLMLPKHHSHAGAGPTSGTSRIIPPPPPFLNGDSNLANNPSALPEDDDDDVLASMLMSWYMTGYHTGYYQARKDMKNNNR